MGLARPVRRVRPDATLGPRGRDTVIRAIAPVPVMGLGNCGNDEERTVCQGEGASDPVLRTGEPAQSVGLPTLARPSLASDSKNRRGQTAFFHINTPGVAATGSG